MSESSARKIQAYHPIPLPSDSSLTSLPTYQFLFQMVRQYWYQPREKKQKTKTSNFPSTRNYNLNKNCWKGLHFPSNLKFFYNALIFSIKLKYMMLKISKHFMHEVLRYLKLFLCNALKIDEAFNHVWKWKRQMGCCGVSGSSRHLLLPSTELKEESSWLMAEVQIASRPTGLPKTAIIDVEACCKCLNNY